MWFGHNLQNISFFFFHIVTKVPFDLVIFGRFLIGRGHKFSEFACFFFASPRLLQKERRKNNNKKNMVNLGVKFGIFVYYMTDFIM